MAYHLTKLFLSAAIIVVVSEVAKVNATLGAFLWTDTADRAAISDLSVSTFWLVIPTLPMFLVLPALLERGWGFYPALAASMGVMLLCYVIAVPILARFGLTI